MPLRQIVVNGHAMSGADQFFNADRSDVTRASGDKDVHAPGNLNPSTVRGGQRQEHLHGGLLSRRAVDEEIAPVQVREPPGDDQPQTHALLLVKTAFKLHVRADVGDLLRGHSSSTIAERECETVVGHPGGDQNSDLPLRGSQGLPASPGRVLPVSAAQRGPHRATGDRAVEEPDDGPMHGPLVTDEQGVILPRQLDILGAGNVPGQVPAI